MNNRYISQPDFETVLSSESSLELAQVIAEYMKDTIIAKQEKDTTIFRITDNAIWERIVRDEFTRMCLQLLSDSSKHWIKALKTEMKTKTNVLKAEITEIEKDAEDIIDKKELAINTKKENQKRKELKLLTEEFTARLKQYTRCKYLKVAHFEKDILKMLLVVLTNDNIQFDCDPDGIHFLNGRYNLVSGKFEERTPSHYISTLGGNSYDYEEPTAENKKYMINEVSKLFNTKEDCDYTLFLLGAILSGRFSKQQIWLFFYGLGGSGKSFLIDLFAHCVGDQYVKMFQKETFSNACSASDRNKTLNSITPNIRIYKINELDSKTLDKNLIKQFADGEIETTKLYKDGSHLLKILGVLVMISNEMVSFNSDTGINRRLLGYEFKNKFTENEKEVNNQNVFLNDRHFIEHLSVSQKVAFFHILAENCKMWYDKKLVDKSQGYKETTSMITSINDFWGEVIENCMKESNNEYDWLAVDEILEVIHTEYPSKQKTINRKHVISGFKGKGYLFNKDKMINRRKKGAFQGLIIKYDEENDDLDNPLFEETTETINLKEEVARLTKELQKAQEKIKSLTQKPKTKDIMETLEEESISESKPSTKSPKVKKNKSKTSPQKPNREDIFLEFDESVDVEI